MMRLPLLLDKKPIAGLMGPQVLLSKGDWLLETNTTLFVYRLRELEIPGGWSSPVGGDRVELNDLMVIQIELTGADVDKVSIFAMKH